MAIPELFVEYISKKNIEAHSQFRRLFRKLAVIQPHKFNIVTINELITKCDELHRFFYEGTNLEPDIKQIENKWNDLHNYLQNKIKDFRIK